MKILESEHAEGEMRMHYLFLNYSFLTEIKTVILCRKNKIQQL